MLKSLLMASKTNVLPRMGSAKLSGGTTSTIYPTVDVQMRTLEHGGSVTRRFYLVENLVSRRPVECMLNSA